MGEDPHVFLIGLWENPGDPRWRVPREDVSNAVDVAFARFDVVELACDPWGWQSEIQAWADRHGDGEPRLAAHVAHCIAKSTPMGDLVSKDKRGSPRKIDAAVAAIVALDRAAWHTNNRTKKRARSFA